jgi:hypothetical protein
MFILDPKPGSGFSPIRILGKKASDPGSGSATQTIRDLFLYVMERIWILCRTPIRFYLQTIRSDLCTQEFLWSDPGFWLFPLLKEKLVKILCIGSCLLCWSDGAADVDPHSLRLHPLRYCLQQAIQHLPQGETA